MQHLFCMGVARKTTTTHTSNSLDIFVNGEVDKIVQQEVSYALQKGIKGHRSVNVYIPAARETLYEKLKKTYPFSVVTFMINTKDREHDIMGDYYCLFMDNGTRPPYRAV